MGRGKQHFLSNSHIKYNLNLGFLINFREKTQKKIIKTMKLVPACVGLLAAVTSSTVVQMDRPTSYDLESLQAQWPDIERAWTEFKELYEKAYDTASDETHRMKVWVDNLVHINTHNMLFKEGKKSYTLEMNQYADLTSEEFLGPRNGYKHSMKKDRSDMYSATRPATYMLPANFEESKLPTGVDWRKTGHVTGVKNQGQCGSCWSFSTTGALEGQMMRKNGVLPSLSEQNLIDCSKKEGNMGCNGGLMDNAFDYIKHQDGIDSEESYPYEMRDDQPCRYHQEDRAGDDVGFVDIPSGSEKHLMAALANEGPVAVAIDAAHRSFQFYSTGIYYEPECSSMQLDHGVLAVGYGDACEDEGDEAAELCSSGHSKYYIVKNSWGTEWGDGGFIKMAAARHNHCGIATASSYPLV